MPASLIKNLRHRAEYAALRSLAGLTGALPPPLAARVGTAAGEFTYRVLRARRAVVEENLASTLGMWLDRRSLDAIARGVYHHLGRTLFEYAGFMRLDRRRLDAWVEVRGLEHVEAAHASGRGVILVTGHFGNWELLGAVVSMRGYPLHFLAREQRNPYVDRFLDRSRRSLGVGLVTRGPGLRRIYRLLRAGEMLGMLFDQDGGSRGMFLDVLGRVASVQTGAAVFSLRTGAPLVPGFIVRLPDGRHRAVFEEAIVPDLDAPRAEELERLVKGCAASLERYVLRYPEQYYWVHRRWKTRPPGEGGDDGGASGG